MSQKAPREMFTTSLEKPPSTFAFPIKGEETFSVKSPAAGFTTMFAKSAGLRLKEEAPGGKYPQSPLYALWSHWAAPPTKAPGPRFLGTSRC